jgi:hypothetical protein
MRVLLDTAIASAPATKRDGGSCWLASWTSAPASLPGSPPWRSFMAFQAAMVCLVRSAWSSIEGSA